MDRPQSDRPQGDRFASDRISAERPTSERVQPERSGDDRPARAPREDRPRLNREDRPARVERAERVDRDPLGVIEPESTPLTVAAIQPSEGPMLRADDGEISHAPAFLQVRAAEPRADGAEEPRRPRRRRAPATFSAPQESSGDQESEGA